MLKSLKFAPALLLLAVLAAGCGGGTAGNRSAIDLTNLFLGPDWSSWLVGPIARLATPEEIQAYLALKDDAAAAAFAESFWKKRGEPVRQAYAERAVNADRLYSESGYLGHRTDRGAIFVIYGRPLKEGFEVSPSPKESAVEVWTYGPDAPSGLDGNKPNPTYRFIKRGDLTVTYVPRLQPVTMPPVQN